METWGGCTSPAKALDNVQLAETHHTSAQACSNSKPEATSVLAGYCSGSASPVLFWCQVPDCTTPMAGSFPAYYQKFRICQHHRDLPQVQLHGQLVRFCQQCGKFQDLLDFDGERRSCRLSLEKHNARRRQKRTARKGAPCTSDGGLHAAWHIDKSVSSTSQRALHPEAHHTVPASSHVTARRPNSHQEKTAGKEGVEESPSPKMYSPTAATAGTEVGGPQGDSRFSQLLHAALQTPPREGQEQGAVGTYPGRVVGRPLAAMQHLPSHLLPFPPPTRATSQAAGAAGKAPPCSPVDPDGRPRCRHVRFPQLPALPSLTQPFQASGGHGGKLQEKQAADANQAAGDRRGASAHHGCEAAHEEHDVRSPCSVQSIALAARLLSCWAQRLALRAEQATAHSSSAWQGGKVGHKRSRDSIEKAPLFSCQAMPAQCPLTPINTHSLEGQRSFLHPGQQRSQQDTEQYKGLYRQQLQQEQGGANLLHEDLPIMPETLRWRQQQAWRPPEQYTSFSAPAALANGAWNMASQGGPTPTTSPEAPLSSPTATAGSSGVGCGAHLCPHAATGAGAAAAVGKQGGSGVPGVPSRLVGRVVRVREVVCGDLPAPTAGRWPSHIRAPRPPSSPPAPTDAMQPSS